MRLLLDTHVLLWVLLTPHRLPLPARDALEDPEHIVFFSAASLWEIAIKRALERPEFMVEPEVVRAAALGLGFDELPVTGIHAVAVRHLPLLHRDPFDRLLVAQADTEPLILMTNDPLVAVYRTHLWRL